MFLVSVENGAGVNKMTNITYVRITYKTAADGEAVDGTVVEQDATWVGLLWKQNKDPEP